MKYECKECKYVSFDKSNYNKHMKSKSHNNNISDSIQHVSRLPSKFNCQDCGEKFAYSSGYYRHRKSRCPNIKKDFNDEQLKTEKLELEVERLKFELNKMNSQLLKYVSQNKPTNTTNNTYNISVKNYIQQNYSDAPALEGITDYSKLTFEDNEFIETLAYNYNNNTLHKYLGDFIVGYYSKENPSEQSLWNSDVSRLTYIIKELLANNQSNWNHDFKGVKVKSYVINPLLKYIRKCINDYLMTHIDRIKSGDIEAIRLQEIYIAIHRIKLIIDNSMLADDIVRYIAPKFYMDKRDLISDQNNDLFIDNE
ncbi:zinc finger C2H2-type protein [Fadolivirus algeromassiliense]|jgi:hypothetical protein|uniref:Zinc finger C2H2-type protein n=1 Tax=Fadolivirus FV1/VV64 TaxID=3070911 RepID=A0A7D3UU90_9VIRU|nr:zinc finger C2H2-type protein [Fadolivirus algeromassiliense]QKF93991.1 zinc finger C2H2-type protein [Fadolivirus FV1/VV64]